MRNDFFQPIFHLISFPIVLKVCQVRHSQDLLLLHGASCVLAFDMVVPDSGDQVGEGPEVDEGGAPILDGGKDIERGGGGR